MCTNNEQDGCQPPPLPQPPIVGARSTNTEQRAICRNFIWGTCSKHAQCKFKHVLDIEEMKKVLKFCHDFQNKGGCAREDCTYLHTTREEENLFHATGTLPGVLAERHAAMAAAAAAAAAASRTAMNLSNESMNSVPQITPYVEQFMNQPPPPPLGPATSTAVVPVQTQSATQSIQSAMAAVPPPPPPPPPRISVHAVQQPPPPPPPPPPPAKTSQPQPPTVSYSSPVPQTYSGNQEPQFPLFDASRPPPPLPSNIINNNNLKRKGQPDNEAGPNKRMTEGVDDADSDCSNCLQAEKRINYYKEQLESLLIEEKQQSALCKKKMEELDAAAQILSSLIGPDLTQILMDHLELEEQALESNDEDSQPQQSPSPTFSNSTGSSTSNFQNKLFIVNTLMDFMGGNSRNETSPSSRMEDALLSALSSSSPPRNSNHSRLPSSNIVQALFDFCDDTKTESTQRHPGATRSEEREQIAKETLNGDRRFSGGSSGVSVSNGFSQPFCNGQKAVMSNAPSVPSIAPQYYAGPGVPGGSGIPTVPGAAYPTFQPPPPPSGPSLSNANHSYPLNGGAHPLPIRPVAMNAPSTGIDLNYYGIGRYPNPQQYYPPYQ